MRYTEKTAVLVKTYKDKGEQRLAGTLASIMKNFVPPSWTAWAECVTYVTASKGARRRRGFDHMELIARDLAESLSMPCEKLLEAPDSNDQRTLTRAGRMSNMAGRFRPVRATQPRNVLLVDDVFTTGSTMEDAREALEGAGHACRCLVLARA